MERHEMVDYKYKITCQICSGSLTVEYTVHSKEYDAAVKNYLTNLMDDHYKHPLEHHDYEGEIPRRDDIPQSIEVYELVVAAKSIVPKKPIVAK